MENTLAVKTPDHAVVAKEKAVQHSIKRRKKTLINHLNTRIIKTKGTLATEENASENWISQSPAI